MTPADVWLRVGVVTALASASLVTLSPARPELQVTPVVAVVGGAIAGLALFSAVARRRPRLVPRTVALRLLIARWVILALLAANEELIWRRALLGECLRAGSAAALAGSTLAFALAHRSRPGLHLGTGAAFGGLYLGTGVVTASIAAHWIYNVLLSIGGEPDLASGRAAAS
ncbi:MAG TPA: CPBP family intramembrane glutamic endopeptidase [Gaiellaceae bacterium]|nr:CPBP family intramembrane glutamic endopeptidase [Gaiellaceae bacterium]